MTVDAARKELEEYLTVADVAQHLSISRQAVEKAIRDGKLQTVEAFGIRLVHEWWLMDYEDVRAGKVASVQPEELQEAPKVASAQPTPIYKEERPTVPPVPIGRTSPPAMENPRVKPRPKGAWLRERKGRSAQESEQTRE